MAHSVNPRSLFDILTHFLNLPSLFISGLSEFIKGESGKISTIFPSSVCTAFRVVILLAHCHTVTYIICRQTDKAGNF